MWGCFWGVRALDLISVDALGSLPPVEFLANTHLVARGLNILFGPSGAFKSFYMLDAALTIAQLAPVVYVAAEGSSGLHQRVDAWCKHYGLSGGNLHFICQEVNLLIPDQVSALIEKIGTSFKYKTALVVFDTYARCISGGDENSAKDTGKAVQQCAQIQRQLRCGVSLVHHTNRAERGERGSGAMRGAADLMIEMSANGDNTIKVDCSKAKDSKPWTTEFYRFLPVNASGVLVPATLNADDELTKRQVEMLDFLGMEIFIDTGAKGIQLTGGLNVSQATLYRALSDLKRRGFVRQDRMGDPYFITEKGKQILAFHSQEFSQKLKEAKSSDPEVCEDDSQDSHTVIN